jgi:hypothetical protein
VEAAVAMLLTSVCAVSVGLFLLALVSRECQEPA